MDQLYEGLELCRHTVLLAGLVLILMIGAPLAMLLAADCPGTTFGEIPAEPTTHQCRLVVAGWMWICLDAALLCALVLYSGATATL